MKRFTVCIHGLTSANKNQFEEAFNLFLAQHPYMCDESGKVCKVEAYEMSVKLFKKNSDE